MSEPRIIQTSDVSKNERFNESSPLDTFNKTITPLESMRRKIEASALKSSSEITERENPSKRNNKPVEKTIQAEKSFVESSIEGNKSYTFDSIHSKDIRVETMSKGGSSNSTLISIGDKNKTDEERTSRTAQSHTPNNGARFGKQLSLELNLDDILSEVNKTKQKYLNNAKEIDASRTEELEWKEDQEIHKTPKRTNSSKRKSDQSIVRASSIINGKKRTVTKIRLLKTEKLDDFDVSKLSDYERKTFFEHIEKERKRRNEISKAEAGHSGKKVPKSKDHNHENHIQLNEIEFENICKENESPKVQNKEKEEHVERTKYNTRNFDTASLRIEESVEMSPDGSVQRISQKLNNGTRRILTKIRILKDKNSENLDVENLNENQRNEFLKKLDKIPTHNATSSRLSAFLRDSIDNSIIPSFKVTHKDSGDEKKKNDNPRNSQIDMMCLSEEMDSNSNYASEILDGDHEHGSLRKGRSM